MPAITFRALGRTLPDWTRPNGRVHGMAHLWANVGCIGTTDVADAAITIAKLGFDPATQTELNALNAAGTVNTTGNPVDWTKLKSVPAGFADGVDNEGGTPSDLVCSGCVHDVDLADGAVTTAKISAGAVGTVEIASSAVTSSEIATGAVGSSEIATDAIGSSEIATGAVGTAEIANGSVSALDLAPGNILLVTALIDGTTATIGAGLEVTRSVSCAGYRIASGGWEETTSGGGLVVKASYATDSDTWFFRFRNENLVASVTVVPKILCFVIAP